jgi:hypothetical protein
MITRAFLPLLATLVLAVGSMHAADTKLGVKADEEISTVLPRLVGMQVSLRLRSGENIAGKLEIAGPKVVHLSALSGAEFFEAAVAVADISAVVVRSK